MPDETATWTPPDGWPSWLTTTDHIGSHYPYHRTGVHSQFFLSFSDAIESIPVDARKLDLAGVVEVLSKRYPLFNRTLVSGLERSPWLGRPDDDGWYFHSVPQHSSEHPNDKQVLECLKRSLKQETLNYVGDHDQVGILLSGGLDSRIVAGILRELQLDDEVFANVCGLSWGMADSRDVRYAAEIADRFGWDFQHYELGPETLRRNIYRMGRLGAEASPLHLHALPEIRETDIDVVLAGSYGNSIGRGEYSGKWLRDLEATVPNRLNSFGWITQSVINETADTVHLDAYGYRDRIGNRRSFQYREIERQMHYMRRMLQFCMSHVAERIPLYQLFTSPETVEIMWSLDPDIRDDRHYRNLLQSLPSEVADIPYARTGRPFGSEDGERDRGPKNYHRYGPWLRDDLRDVVLDLISSSKLHDGLLNEHAFDRLLSVWKRAGTMTTNQLDETVSWLASLSVLLDEYDVQVPPLSHDSSDRLKGIIGPAHAFAYQTARERFRE